jgi:hypothetical protein
MPKPYTYLIGWPELDRWYYGIRFAKKAHPDDLWVTYFTSSKHVKAFAAEHGPPTIKQIRKIFEEGGVDKAREYEHKVLRRMKVVKSSRWLNKTDGKSRPSMVGDDNHMRSPEHRKRFSENNPMKNPEIAAKTASKLRGVPKPWQQGDKNVSKLPEVQKAISDALYGRTNDWMIGDKNHMRSPEHRQRFSENNPMTNPESVEKLRKSKTGVKHKIVMCPHCGKSGGHANMTRYHFDNCKKTLNAKSMV